MRRERGTSLIFVLGILALLSLFAISFATVTRVERVASANYVDEVRAKLAARAGLAAGIAAAHESFRTPSPRLIELGGYLDTVRTVTAQANGSVTLGSVMGIGPGDTITLFGGDIASGGDTKSEDVTVASGYTPGTNPVTLVSGPKYPGRLFALPRGANWFYHGHSQNPVSTGNGVPLAIALGTEKSPSSGTAPGPGHGVPSLHVLTGPTLRKDCVRFASGSTGGTYFADDPPGASPYLSGGDLYGTKILDTAGMLDANMPQAELDTILDQFGKDVVQEVTDISAKLAPFVPGINKLIPLQDVNGVAYGSPFTSAGYRSAFFAYRDKLSGKRFRSKEQVKGAFYAMVPSDAERAEAWFAVFRDYLACYGDRDLNEVAGDDPQGTWNPSGGMPLKTAAVDPVSGAPYPANKLNFDNAKVFQNAKKVDTVDAPRMPVNVNTAPLPVLVAILSTVRARALPTMVVAPGADPLAPISINPNIVPMAPYPANAGNGTVTALTRTEAQNIAKVLVEKRPFRSWNEVYKALNTLHGTGGAPGPVSDQALAAAIVATCPVQLPLSLNPDRSLFFWDAVNPDDPAAGFRVLAEKATSHSCADFCFTSGYFEVESMGRVYANPTAPFVVAEATKRCVVNVGGVVWVRGQRDLSQGLPSDIVGAPALAPGDSYVGGWIQPKPADSGVQLAGSLTGTAASMNPWTASTTDGFIMQRSQWDPIAKDVMIAKAATSPTGGMGDDQGTVEMWVKQPFDMTQGTNEALFMNVRNYNPGLRHAEPGYTDDPDAAATVTQIGVATRLERFGNQLYFCRFFWGYPDGASPAKVGEETDAFGIATAANPTTKYVDHMHGYITSPPLQWKAGTWHHVYISWNVMNLKMFVDGQDMGTPSLPTEYKGGVVWENTVQGFFPDAGSGGLDNNNQFKNVARDTAGEQQVRDAIAAAQAHIPVDQGIIDNKSSSQTQVNNATAHKAQDQKVINDGNDWLNGGGAGGFASDVHGMTFTAQLGLRRMKLRTHAPIPGASDAQADQGITESYFLGYKTPDPYNGESPPEIVTLAFKFGNSGNSFYRRYCNGTFDAVKWQQSPILSAPTPVPHRYKTDDASFDTKLNLPSGWIPVAHGYHVIAAYDVFSTPDVDLFGGGRTDGMTVTGQNVTLTKSFPAGKATCNVPSHSQNCVAGSNEVPWAVGGAWIAYEKPTTFLEAPEVD